MSHRYAPWVAVLLVMGAAIWFFTRTGEPEPSVSSPAREPARPPEVRAPAPAPRAHAPRLPLPEPAVPLAPGRGPLGGNRPGYPGAPLPPAPQPPPVETNEAEPATSGEPTAQRGSLDPADVRAAIEQVKPAMRQCFEAAATRYPPPQKITLQFTIVAKGLGGYFKDGEIADSTYVDPFVQTCFLEALTNVRFPAPRDGEVTVKYPFSFTAPPPAPPAP